MTTKAERRAKKQATQQRKYMRQLIRRRLYHEKFVVSSFVYRPAHRGHVLTGDGELIEANIAAQGIIFLD